MYVPLNCFEPNIPKVWFYRFYPHGSNRLTRLNKRSHYFLTSYEGPSCVFDNDKNTGAISCNSQLQQYTLHNATIYCRLSILASTDRQTAVRKSLFSSYPKIQNSMRLLIRTAFCLLLLDGDCHCHGFLFQNNGRAATKRHLLTPPLPTTPAIACRMSSQRTSTGMDTVATNDHLPTRREIILASMAGLTAEAAWQRAVETAALAMEDEDSGAHFGAATAGNKPILPQLAIQQIESGRAVIVPNWLSSRECEELRIDVQQCFAEGHFKKFILSRDPNQADKAADDRWIMNSYIKSLNKDGPFADPTVGNFALRQTFKARMAETKALLSRELKGRSTLAAANLEGSHEMEYLRYGAGAQLQRHTDEHHVELQRPNGSRLPKKQNATRRSITWMVYLNDDWDGARDGGHLRLHERANPAVSNVGSQGQDLQIGWLKATATDGEQPVFLDPLREGPTNENCVLYVVDAVTGVSRDLSSKPFANVALHLGGGDNLARKLMLAENPTDAKRFHLIDAPKSSISGLLPSPGEAGVDGGERIHDIEPKAGTLVMFDSVSLPHEVMLTKKERYGIQGWFHEELGYQV